jgi:hypothetical protein
MQMPSATRPQRPARWLAAAWLIGDLQLLDLAAVAVALDARQPGIDDEADARHRERGLGHVGGQDDAPCAVRLEHTLLLGLRQPREQRQDFRGRAAPIRIRQVLAQVISGLADLALAGQEHQDVARRTAAPQLVDRVGNRIVEAVVAAFLERPPALLHREQAARYLDHRCRPARRSKVLRKPVGVDGGRRHHHFEVGAPRQQLLR